jgi:hypothetical protein
MADRTDPRDREPPTGDRADDEAPDPVELGVALLDRLEHAELSVAAAIDRIEAVTTVPGVQREILETAERRGVIEREGATVRPATRGVVRFESEVVQRDGEFECQRCGAALSTGYFVRLDPGEVGPYGSSCVRKVTGRE